MKKKIAALMLALVSVVFCFSCTRIDPDITGYYSVEKLNNLYYFAPDGKLYENESFESYTCYEIEGNKLILYVEGDREGTKMEFPIKMTEKGFMMGEVEYIKIEMEGYTDGGAE